MQNLTTPPLLLGAALVFWGWQADLLPVGVLLAVVFEGSRLLPQRWEFSQADLDRIWNLTLLVCLGAAAYAFFGGEGLDLSEREAAAAGRRGDALMRSSRSVLLLFQWLPMLFAPMALAQALGRQGQMHWSTFSWFLRRGRQASAAGRGAVAPSGGLNVSFPYFGSVVLAASAANKYTWFYTALVVLLVWALWTVRSRRLSLLAWGGTIVLAAGVGFAGQEGFRYLQRVIDGVDNLLITRFVARAPDVKETRTALGALGKLKLSGRIVLRVDPEGHPTPELLREATYTQFKSPLWYNAVSRREFRNAFAEDDNSTWNLLPRKLTRKSVNIWRYLDNNSGLLAVPNGVSRLEIANGDAFSVATNLLGAIQASGPSLINYLAYYDDGASLDTPPADEDRSMPGTLEDWHAIDLVAQELKLEGKSPQEAIARVANHFLKNFTYSTWLAGTQIHTTNRSPLAVFLLERHAGHCEYFAAATVLLLRKAGIPTRYATGYAVQERSGDLYIVRERHAHAWCLAWVDGAWRDIDTTPASWSENEERLASLWEPITDWWSQIWFWFSKWRWSRSELRPYLFLLTVPPIGLLAFRLIFRRQWNRFRRQKNGGQEALPWPGADSEFYLVEQRLARAGLTRPAAEPALAWLRRIEAQLPGGAQALRELLRLHYRLRFDPLGLAAAERSSLQAGVKAWLAQMVSKRAPAAAK